MTPQARSRSLLLAAAALAVAVAVWRVLATATVFSQTYDEPAHIAAGMEWLERGTYTYESLHPPLGRVAAAIGPYLDGARGSSEPDIWKAGNGILYDGGSYVRTLALARAGLLPFLVLAIVAVWVWCAPLFGVAAAAAAVLLLTTVPPVLAHAGLATTDIALTATLPLALLALVRWLDRPTARRSVALGALVGLALSAKLSAALFLAACGIMLAVVRLAFVWRSLRVTGRALGRLALHSALAACVTATVVWAAYRFSVGPLMVAGDPLHEGALSGAFGAGTETRARAARVLQAAVYPAPQFARGLLSVVRTNAAQQRGYLLGETYTGGRWTFFPIAIAVKTPIPFLLLATGGTIAAVAAARRSRDWRFAAPAVAAVATVAAVLPGALNIGLRHVLPVFPLLAIVAGAGALALWRVNRLRPLGPALLAALVVWQFVVSARAHPDYLAYFNELADDDGPPALVDSDLDWGQDLHRLRGALRARGVEKVSLGYFGTAEPARHGLPRYSVLSSDSSATGWIAVSMTPLYAGQHFAWLRGRRPTARVGRSMLLYYVPPSAAPDTVAEAASWRPRGDASVTYPKRASAVQVEQRPPPGALTR